VVENLVVPERRFAFGRLWTRRVTRAERDRAISVLDNLGLAPYADSSPADLSYGQRKLVELAQVLWLDPVLVMLDEPAAGISPALSARLADLVRSLHQRGVGILLVEHDLAFIADLCQRVCVLAHGSVIAQGSVAGRQHGRGRRRRLSRRLRHSGGAVMIHIEGLWAGYGGLDILRGVDLRVARGSINCVVGPNGAGKSTVLKTISGLLRPRRGAIAIDGVDLSGKPPATILAAGVVQVPQRNGLFREAHRPAERAAGRLHPPPPTQTRRAALRPTGRALPAAARTPGHPGRLAVRRPAAHRGVRPAR